MPKAELSDATIRRLDCPDQGQVLWFDSHRDAATGLMLRLTPGAKTWALDYRVDGRQRRLTLGRYPELGPKAARDLARKKIGEVYRGVDPLAQKAERRAAKVQAEAAAKAAAEAQAMRKRFTLGALLLAYSDELERRGKRDTAQDTRTMWRLHVEQAFPALWVRPAADVEPEDGVTLLAPLLIAEKRRTAGKLRAYARSAYALAIRARLDPVASQALRDFKLKANPFAEVAAIAQGGGGVRERALSVAELRAYWRRIQNDPVLRLHLLSGAQRVEQMSRAKVADLNLERNTLRLWDSKGKRSAPREHIIPLLPEALAAIEAMAAPRRRGDFVFTATQGKTGCRYDAFRARLAPIVEAMKEAGEAAPFTPGDLRRTVETRLAALGVSQEVRAQLQSHGLSGVQARHYDRHDYLAEKRDALERFVRLMDTEPADVVPIGRRRVEA